MRITIGQICPTDCTLVLHAEGPNHKEFAIESWEWAILHVLPHDVELTGRDFEVATTVWNYADPRDAVMP